MMSCMAYEQLELYFNKCKKREEYLYNLVRSSAIIGKVLVTEKYGSLFLKTFPNSKYVESVRSMMLTSLFMEGEYEKCIEVATIMLPKLPKPSKQHDICLHVLGCWMSIFRTAWPGLRPTGFGTIRGLRTSGMRRKR